MKPVVVVSREIVARKPAHGKPCTHCGVCCLGTLCAVGFTVFNRTRGPCPALRWEGVESRCGMVTEPEHHVPRLVIQHGAERVARAAETLIFSGGGCDCRINGEPADDAFYDEMDRWDREHDRAIVESKRLLGIKKWP